MADVLYSFFDNILIISWNFVNTNKFAIVLYSENDYYQRSKRNF